MTSPPHVNRLCYAAAHVAMREEYREVPHSPEVPGSAESIGAYIDWTTTMSLRTRLDGLGFAVAEAMDTAQRFSLGWKNAQRLIVMCGDLDLANGFVAGAGTDHLDKVESASELVEAVVYQATTIRAHGGEVILLPLSWLTDTEASEDDYVRHYTEIIDRLDGPLYLHWLGEAFAPNLAGYFPGESFFNVMAHDPAKVRGAKLSLLDAEFEETARERVAQDGQIILTGDDFNFASLIQGDGLAPSGVTEIGTRRVPTGNFSHALLGVFDGIAEPASYALERLAAGDIAEYDRVMAPCEALGRKIFEAPTQHYKAGLAFLAWLGGLQDNPMLINHEERTRPLEHYREVAQLAVEAGVLPEGAFTPEREKQLREYLAG